MEQVVFIKQVFGQGGFIGVVYGFFCCNCIQYGFFGDFLCCIYCFVYQFFVWYDVGYKVGMFGFVSIYEVFGQMYVYGFRFFDIVCQVLCVVKVCNNIQIDFGLVEFCGVRGNDEVVYYCQFVVIVKCVVRYSCDDWFVDFIDCVIVVVKIVREEYFNECFFVYFFNVGIGGKGFF